MKLDFKRENRVKIGQLVCSVGYVRICRIFSRLCELLNNK